MNEIVDYALPCMMAENALKKLHQHMLENEYEAAMQAGSDALVEVFETLRAIRIMKEKAKR